MDKILIRIFKILSVVIMLLGVFLFVLVLINGNEFETNAALSNKILNPFANLTLAAILIALAGAVIFPVINMFQSGKQLMRFVILLVVFVGLALLSYSLSHNQFNATQLQDLDTTVQESRIVGAGLIFTYIVGGLTVIALIYSGISGFFKR